MIDTHCHIYDTQFKDDLPAVIERAKSIGVEYLFMPNVDEETIAAMHQVEEAYPEYCFSMMGLHPTSVNADYQQQLDKVYKELNRRSYIAVGEIGLDLYWDKTFIKQQIEVFEKQIVFAKEMGLPVVIHCRDAFDEVFEVLDLLNSEELSGVFHSFTGDDSQAQKILEYGNFLFGINGVVTFKNTTLREVLSKVPLSKLILETDSPYLAPVPFRGKRNEPAYVEKVASQIAAVYEVSIDEVKNVTSKNAKRLFNI